MGLTEKHWQFIRRLLTDFPMKRFLSLVVLFSTLSTGFLHAQVPMPTPAFTSAESEPDRFRILSLVLNNQTVIIRLDTVSGRSWTLQPTSEQDRKSGTFFVWIEVPSLGIAAPAGK